MSLKDLGLFAKRPNMPVNEAALKLLEGVNGLQGHVKTMFANRGGESNKAASEILQVCNEAITSMNTSAPQIESSDPKIR